MSTSTAPERILIVRHSIRLDKEQRDWSRGAKRPQDPPITEGGKDLARQLGSYLRSARLIDFKNTVFLVSPLGRCIQTAHAIAEGLTEVVGKEALPTVPIHIEESLCEGAYWIYQDIVRNRGLRGDNFPPLPIYHNAAFHKENTSPLVVLHDQQNPSFALGPAPTFIKTGNDELVEEPRVQQRCRSGVVGLLNEKRLAGKVVICVGHGETCQLWAHSLSAVPINEAPTYTGFLEFRPQPVDAATSQQQQQQQQVAAGKDKYTTVCGGSPRESLLKRHTSHRNCPLLEAAH
ncbi:histidine phosphatase, putative, partial [Bodo saltans]